MVRIEKYNELGFIYSISKNQDSNCNAVISKIFSSNKNGTD